MTRAEIMTQILSEASGEPPARVQGLLEDFRKMSGGKDKFDTELGDSEAQKLLKSLRGELPGIRAWLAEGNRMARIKIGLD